MFPPFMMSPKTIQTDRVKWRKHKAFLLKKGKRKQKEKLNWIVRPRVDPGSSRKPIGCLSCPPTLRNSWQETINLYRNQRNKNTRRAHFTHSYFFVLYESGTFPHPSPPHGSRTFLLSTESYGWEDKSAMKRRKVRLREKRFSLVVKSTRKKVVVLFCSQSYFFPLSRIFFSSSYVFLLNRTLNYQETLETT